jgi:hypothetical protein
MTLSKTQPETDMNTANHILVQACREQLHGTIATVDGWPVAYVAEFDKPAVRYRKYVTDYSRRSERPWKVGSTGYSSLANALRALSLKALPAEGN